MKPRKRQRTQREMIREHLNKGFSITPMGALQMFGYFRLAAIIFLLREEGMNIKTTYIEQLEQSGKGKKYASYKLEK